MHLYIEESGIYTFLRCDYNFQIANCTNRWQTLHKDKQKQPSQLQSQHRAEVYLSQGVSPCVVISVNECASEEMSSVR